MHFRKFIIIGLISTILIVTPLMMNAHTSDILSSQNMGGQQIAINQTEANITGVELLLGASELEFGDRQIVTYGIIGNNSNYVANISHLMYLFDGDLGISTIDIADARTTLFNETSLGELETIYIDTIPANTDPLLPGPYTVFYTTDLQNGTNYNSSAVFEVFPHEGANIEITFSELDSVANIIGPVNMEKNESRDFQITITNSGSGNALDVQFGIEIVNGPLGVDSSTLPINIPVLNPFNQTKLTFSVNTPDFGISRIQFSLFYSRESGRTITESPLIEFRILPEITGSIEVENEVKTGDYTEFTTSIRNLETEIFSTSFFMSSTSFTFSPQETQQADLNPGETEIIFSGVTFTNGTATLALFMTYLDPIGNDQIDIELDSVTIEVISAPIPSDGGSGLPLLFILFLYLILFLGIAGFFLNRRFRSFIVNNIMKSEFVPDIDFREKKVIVDGSNVAWEELTEDGKPKIENILQAIETLQEYGFEEILVVADAALRYQIENPKALDQQSKLGTIKVLPAKVDGDSFILRLSRDVGALILTNDLYREYRERYSWIDDRRIPYSILDGNFYLHPIYDMEERNASSN